MNQTDITRTYAAIHPHWKRFQNEVQSSDSTPDTYTTFTAGWLARDDEAELEHARVREIADRIEAAFSQRPRGLNDMFYFSVEEVLALVKELRG
jgi:hypothetical protein